MSAFDLPCEWPQGCDRLARRADAESRVWHNDQRPIYCDEHDAMAESHKRQGPSQPALPAPGCEEPKCNRHRHAKCWNRQCNKDLCRQHVFFPLASAREVPFCRSCAQSIKREWNARGDLIAPKF